MVDDQLTACIGSGLLTCFLMIFHLCNGDCSVSSSSSCFVVWRFVVAARIRILVFPGFAGVALSCTVRDAVSTCTIFVGLGQSVVLRWIPYLSW